LLHVRDNTWWQEKVLQELLMGETVARIKAEQTLEKLSGQIEFLQKQLEGSKPAHRRN